MMARVVAVVAGTRTLRAGRAVAAAEAGLCSPRLRLLVVVQRLRATGTKVTMAATSPAALAVAAAAAAMMSGAAVMMTRRAAARRQAPSLRACPGS